MTSKPMSGHTHPPRAQEVASRLSEAQRREEAAEHFTLLWRHFAYGTPVDDGFDPPAVRQILKGQQ